MAFTDIGDAVTGAVVPASYGDAIRANFEALDRGVMGAVNIGTGGGLGERWYIAGLIGGQVAATTTGPAVNTFWAVPFVVPQGQRTVDRIAYNVTTGAGAGGVGRAGIYAATSETNLYPSTLVVDGGELTVTGTGQKTSTISAVLESDTVYWACLLFGTNAPVISALPSTAATLAVMGSSTTIANGPDPMFRRTQTYGALPGTFPAGPPTAFGPSTPALISLRFSA